MKSITALRDFPRGNGAVRAGLTITVPPEEALALVQSGDARWADGETAFVPPAPPAPPKPAVVKE